MKKLLVIFSVFLSLFSLNAQNSIKVKAPNLVGLSEQFNISFEIQGEGKISNFTWDPGSDFQIVWGPQEGSSTSVSIINGKTTKTVTRSYTYVLLPKQVGHFTFSAASVKIDGKTLSSDQPAIEVVADSDNRPSSSQDQISQTASVSDADIYLQMSVSKKKIMVGEPITATLKLYQRVNVSGFEGVKFPDFNGFWNQDLENPTNIEFQRESVNGQIFQTAVLHSWTLIPQQSGTLTIEPAELVCLINVRVPRASTGSIFDDFFQDNVRTIRKRLTTKPIEISSNNLPMGAPSSFGGGVGKFTMEVVNPKDTIKTHEASSLKITIKGSGNVTLLEAPQVKFPSDFEVYDLKSSETSGGKVFEYPFIPRSHGDFTIEPIQYSFYDVNRGQYSTISSSSIPITVLKTNDLAPSTSGQVVSGVQRKDVHNLSSDIRYISTSKPSFSNRSLFFIGSKLYYILLICIILGGVAIFNIIRSINIRRADVVGTKNRGAAKMARKRLAKVETYEELHRALLAYISDKFNMDAADLNKDNIALKLSQHSVNQTYIDEFTELLNQCEYARYAPSSNSNINLIYEKAVNIISYIESGMKKSNKSLGVIALVAILMCSPNLFAQTELNTGFENNNTLWTEANQYYAEGDYNSALNSYLNIASSGVKDAQLYYNIGCTYFKLDNISHSILYFERCLLLDPSNKDAIYNLETSNSLIQDKIETLPEFFLTKWIKSLNYSLSSNTWGWMSIVLLVLFVSVVVLFFLGRKRKLNFSLAIVLLVFFIISTSFSFSQRKTYDNSDFAIVTRAVSNVKSSPSDTNAKDLFVLHEGTKLRTLDRLGSWTNIELSDGRQGWILSSDITII